MSLLEEKKKNIEISLKNNKISFFKKNALYKRDIKQDCNLMAWNEVCLNEIKTHF